MNFTPKNILSGKRITGIYFLFILLAGFCFQCEEPIADPPVEPAPKINYLIAGDTSDNLEFIQYNEGQQAIFEGFTSSKSEHSINIQEQAYMYFKYYDLYYLGGMYGEDFICVSGKENLEIAFDTMPQTKRYYIYTEDKSVNITTVFRKIKSPHMFEYGDTIKHDLNWSKYQNLYFSRNVRLEDTLYFTTSFNKWLDSKYHYIAFRVISEDTLLGWMKIKYQNYEYPDTEYGLYRYELMYR